MSVIALFMIFCLVLNVALHHNQVWQCNSIATLSKIFFYFALRHNKVWQCNSIATLKFAFTSPVNKYSNNCLLHYLLGKLPSVIVMPSQALDVTRAIFPGKECTKQLLLYLGYNY